MTDAYTYALISQAAYKGNELSHSGWQEIEVPEQSYGVTYDGRAFYNATTQELVISHAGADIGMALSVATPNVLDGVLNAYEAAYTLINSQADAANAFISALMVVINNDPSISPSSISHTGFGLGGAIADVVAAQRGEVSQTFDNPGTGHLTQVQSAISGFSAISYQSNPNEFNTLHAQAGQVVQLETSPGDAEVEQIVFAATGAEFTYNTLSGNIIKNPILKSIAKGGVQEITAQLFQPKMYDVYSSDQHSIAHILERGFEGGNLQLETHPLATWPQSPKEAYSGFLGNEVIWDKYDEQVKSTGELVGKIGESALVEILVNTREKVAEAVKEMVIDVPSDFWDQMMRKLLPSLQIGDSEIPQILLGVEGEKAVGKGLFIGNDAINILTGAAGSILIGAGGDDKLTIIGTALGSLIDGGDGNDVISGGNGSTVWGGKGVDEFRVGTSCLIADCDTGDRLTFAGYTLTGGFRRDYSESPWTLSSAGIRYAINDDSELGIQAYNNNITFVAGFKNDLSGNATANITLAKLTSEAYQIKDGLPDGFVDKNFDALDIALRAMTGRPYYQTVDPLVLDLDGDGLELVARSSVSPFFDLDHDGFAEQMGWVQPDDGFLVRDANANGIVDDATELFGSQQQHGFAKLATLDSNSDGVIDASDTAFAELRVWQDANGDGITDAGELKTLAEVDVVSIDLDYWDDYTTQNASNDVLAVGSFTRSDNSTSDISNIGFVTDQRDSLWLGDTTVSTEAAALPEVAGKGTLTNLRIAMTDSAPLLDAVEDVLPLLDTLDLSAMRTAIRPLLTEWREAVDVPAGTAGTVARGDVLVLTGVSVTGGAQVYDFAYLASDTEGTYLKLASGDDVLDENGEPITRPQAADILAQDTDSGQEWTTLTGEEIQFIERYEGNALPIGLEDSNTGEQAIGAMVQILNFAWSTLNTVAMRLAIQGPLAEYFPNMEYSVENNNFHATDDHQIAPVLEAIFADAPGTESGDAAYVAAWKPLLDVFLQDFDRGESYLQITYSFLFQNLVAAYENVGLAVSLTEAAGVLDIPQELIHTGTGLLEGGEDADLFYLGVGDQTLEGGAGPDAYIVGQHFGNDVINDFEGVFDETLPDMLRFAQHQADDLSFTRDGNDLVITVDGETDTLRIVNQFTAPRYAPFAPKFDPSYGISEIVFADGTVWDKLDIARAAVYNTPGDDSIMGTTAIDFLDGGAGNDTLIGGMNGDVYAFGEGSGHDQIFDEMEYIFVDSPDIVEFAEGISLDDLTFSRDGNSNDLTITINGTDDTLTVQGQFIATQTGPFGIYWTTRVEGFYTQDGANVLWNDVFDMVIQNQETDGDDSVYGFTWEDTLEGGAGNDYLSGGNMGDIYRFNLGDGQDTIYDNTDNILLGGQDVLEFGADITVENTIFTRVSGTDDLLITFDGVTDSILIQDHYNFIETGVFGVQELNLINVFKWADGTVKGWDDIAREGIAAAKTDGDDFITGYHLDDTLDGGLGNDTLNGGSGNDIFIFGLGYGQDIIQDLSENILSDDFDQVRFGEGIAPEDILIERVGSEDVTLHIAGTTDSLTIKQQFMYTTINFQPYEVESFLFANGTEWDKFDLREIYIAQNSTAGDDLIEGFNSFDTITGGAGNDIMRGWDGSDTYQFSAGFGQDVIEEDILYITYDNQDQIVFDATLNKDDVVWTQDGNDLLITFTGSTDSIRVVNQLEYTFRPEQHGVEHVVFSDGAFTAAEIRANLVSQQISSGDDIVTGFWDNDTIEAGAGNDYLNGRGGDDLYIFGAGFGVDIIEETLDSIYDDYADTVWFTAYDFDDLSFSIQGADLVINVNATSDQLTIKNQFAYYSSIQNFRFADDSTMDEQDIIDLVLANQISSGDDDVQGTHLADVIQSGAGADYILSGLGSDTIEGGLGNDIMDGGLDSDLYIYNLGDGDDVIDDQYGKADTLQLGVGITANDISISSANDGRDVLIEIAGGGSILLKDQAAYLGKQIETVLFDGGSYDAQDIRNILLAQQSSADDDVINGFSSADTLQGGAGNDTLNGGSGDDLYIYNAGDGHDVIDELYGNDTLQFGAGITAADLHFTRVNGDNDILVELSGGGSVLLKDNGAYGNEIETILFDGGSYDAQDIRDAILAQQATVYGDVINGFAVADTLQGGAGNDTLNGGSGDDLYIYNLGDGDDVIVDSYGNDTLQFGTGITAEHLSFSRINDDNDIRIAIAGGGSVILQGAGLYGDEIETILFDGGSYNAQDVRDALMTQQTTAYDDVIKGFAQADTLQGSAGNDILEGGSGDDLYLYEIGDGDDVITELYGNDTLQFGMGITATDLSFSRVNNNHDIRISIAGGGSVTLTDQALSDNKEIEMIRFDGGSYDAQDIRAILLSQDATGGDDVIEGFNAADILEGGAGNDTLKGGSGDDLYIYNLGDGADSIEDVYGADTLRFGEGLYLNDASFWKVNNGQDLRIQFANGSVTIAHPYDSIETFEFVEGGVLTADEVYALAQYDYSGADTITGTAADESFATGPGNDTIHAQGGADTLAGGTGDDMLYGGTGDDTYEYAMGDGNDIIEDDGGNDTLRFASGVTRNNIRATLSDGVLHIAMSDGAEIINERQNQSEYKLDTIVFADEGGSRSIDAILEEDSSQQINGTSGADDLYGWGGDDTIFAFGGNDTMTGGLGEDVFVFAQEANASDVITDFTSGTDHIDIAAFTYISGIGDMTITDENGDAVLALGDGQTIRLIGVDMETLGEEDFIFGSAEPQTIVGSSGNDTLEGAAGDDLIQAGNGNDVLEGKQGADTLEGDGGNDLYIYNAGDGNDVIYDNSGIDTLQFGAGITASDLSFSRSGSSDLLIDVDGGGSVLIQGHFGYNPLEVIAFDGGSYDEQDVRDILLASFTSGNDTIIGFNSADTLQGGLGDDILKGEGGNDTYLYNLGDGDDFIYDNNGTDTLQFGSGITSSDLSFSQVSGSDLLVEIDGGGSVLIDGYFAYNPIESIVYDGGIYDQSDILGLI